MAHPLPVTSLRRRLIHRAVGLVGVVLAFSFLVASSVSGDSFSLHIAVSIIDSGVALNASLLKVRCCWRSPFARRVGRGWSRQAPRERETKTERRRHLPTKALRIFEARLHSPAKSFGNGLLTDFLRELMIRGGEYEPCGEGAVSWLYGCGDVGVDNTKPVRVWWCSGV